jgi:ribosomal protein S18 acetylase RimI-like enzyme
MNYEFTFLNEADINQALALVHEVFDAFVGKDYPEEGRNFFRREVSFEFIRTLPQRNGFSLVSLDKEKIIGIISVRDFSHIALFFVDEKYQGQGIGKHLFEAAKNKITENEKINEMQVHASPYAVSIYQSLGFSIAEEEKEVNGMKFVSMKYPINKVERK